MSHEKLMKDLEDLGLSEKEAQVYMATLSIGESSVQNIAKKSNVNRVTTYVMIEQLTQKGLMSSYTKGKKKMYVAERPERLLSLLYEKEKVIRTQLTHFQGILPMLNAVMARSENKTTIRLYEGIEGLKAAHQVLAAAFKESGFDTYYEVIVPSISENLFSEGDSPARDEVRKTVLENKITSKKIYVYDSDLQKEKVLEGVATFEKITRRHARMLARDLFNFTCEVGLYGNHTVFWLLKDNRMAIVIDDEVVTNNMRQLFFGLWSVSEPITPEDHVDIERKK